MGQNILAKETITIYAGASDDVQIELMQYKFTSNYGSNTQQVGSWITPEVLQDVDGDGSAFGFHGRV